MTATWGLSDHDLTAELCLAFAEKQRWAARCLELVREADGRGLAKRDGAVSTVSWLRDKLRISPHAAKRMTELALALDTIAPAVAAAMLTGAVNEEQAVVIAQAITKLTGKVAAAVMAEAEKQLVALADQFEPHSLQRLASRILDHIAPEIAEEKQRRDLEAAEKQAHRDRAFTLTPAGLGRVRVSGLLDAEGAAIVAAALDPLCAPGRTWVHNSVTNPNGNPATASAGPASPAADADERTPAQRRADALVDICRYALAGGELPANGGEPAQVVVTFGYDDLVERTGAGTLDNGALLSPETVRRIACGAGVIPAVFNSAGQLLDLGRERRLFTGPIRRALVLRDKGCAFPGCDRPARWSDGHHIKHWADGGPTCLSNAVLLCGHHHRLIHHTEWTVHIAADGLPEFIPPAYVDAHRAPRRNNYWRRT